MGIFSSMVLDRPELNNFYFLRYEDLEKNSFSEIQTKYLSENITSLPQLSQKIIWLKYWQNLKVEEISEVLDCSQELVKEILGDSLMQLRTALTKASKLKYRRQPNLVIKTDEMKG